MAQSMLRINLSDRTTQVVEISADIMKKYVGGRGLGAYYLYNLVPKGADPLGDDNHLIFTVGPAHGTGAHWSSKICLNTKSPYTGLREFHRGLDIATREGMPVVASADGVVTFAGKKGFLGKVLRIDHGHRMVTRYGHLRTVLKKRGDVVKRGDIIGRVGKTGRSTGPHLHYEVFLNGIPVNPEKYILN